MKQSQITGVGYTRIFTAQAAHILWCLVAAVGNWPDTEVDVQIYAGEADQYNRDTKSNIRYIISTHGDIYDVCDLITQNFTPAQRITLRSLSEEDLISLAECIPAWRSTQNVPTFAVMYDSCDDYEDMLLCDDVVLQVLSQDYDPYMAI